MARTAPVPNIPAIPGMNPGIFIMGGGGGGGGGSGKGGSGSGGAQGADPNSGGDGAEGGGNGAGSCGNGGTGGCPGAHAGGGHLSAGDPVDIATGTVFTTPALDFMLPGPLALVMERFYRSDAVNRDVGMGWGWSHSLSWEAVVGRRAIHVVAGDGVRHHFEWLDDDLAEGPPGWLLERRPNGFVLDCGDGVRRFFELEVGGHRFLLTALMDLNDNTIALEYQNGRLQTIIDTVGRTIDVSRTADGRIARFVVRPGDGKTHSFWSYSYDAHGQLTTARDALGHSVAYAYDERLMVKQAFRSGLTFHYVYDKEGRCVETWGELPPEEQAFLDPSISAELGSGHPARGIYHCRLMFGDDYVEVDDSMSLNRYHTNQRGKVDKAIVDGGIYDRTYDGAGNMTSFTDPIGGRWSYSYNGSGRMTSSTGPEGHVTSYAFDDAGALERVDHPDGSFVVYERDARGNVIGVHNQDGSVISFVLDRRGMVVEATTPGGGTTRWERDDHGNALRVVEPDGTAKTLTYDGVGRIVTLVSAAGRRYRYDYSLRGELVATHVGNRTEYRSYDAGGRLHTFQTVAGVAYRFRWGGLHMLIEATVSGGGVIRHTYNREGWHVATIDESGQTHRNEYDAFGHIAAETTFDGRRLSYARNAYGAVTRLTTPSGLSTELTYDAMGRLHKRAYSDGREEEFYWDEVGRLIGATSDDAEVTFRHDASGRMVREEHRHGGAVDTVNFAYDVESRRQRMQTSWGLDASVERDVAGRPTSLQLDGTTSCQLQWDAESRLAGVTVGRAHMRRVRNSDGTVARDVLWHASQLVHDGQPAAVDDAIHAACWYRTLIHDDGGRVATTEDKNLGRIDTVYDAAGRVQSRLRHSDIANNEEYAYSASGDVHETTPNAPRRSYGPGGVVRTRGDEHFEYDGDGRMTARYRSVDGKQQAAWRYEYDDAGRLRVVERPDGHRVENTYDALFRRVGQRVLDNRRAVVVEKRFVWSGDALTHVVVRRNGSEEVRSYVFDDNELTLLAQRSDSAPWRFAVPSAQPDVLFDADAKVISYADTTLWGDARWNGDLEAPVGLPGHYFDEEIGLVYNRHRYYDPKLGRYISADPTGIEGGIHLYAYAESRPHELMDPLGVFAQTTIVDADGNTLATGRSGNPDNRPLHPAVAASMPQQHGGMNPNGQTGPLGGCAEPNALSNYLYSVEQGPPPVNLDPNTHGGRRNIGNALARIPPDGIRTDARGSTGAYPRDQPMAPCPNCSRMLSRMRRNFGGLPANAARPGFPGAGDTYPQTRDPSAMVRQQGNHPEYNRRARANARRRRNRTRR